MKNSKLIVLLLFATFAVGGLFACREDAPNQTSAPMMSEHSALPPTAQTVSSAQFIKTIQMPHDEPELPPGAGRETFLASCTVCHSPRYITNQPAFSRKTWDAEVKKMITTYGAYVTDAQAKEITDYLVQIHGKEDSAEKEQTR